MRIKSIDVTKGILILLVMAGHIILGGPATLLHYLIYSFHMPLFIALSGYLVNLDRLQALSFGGLGKKYLYRVIIPWVLAVLVYGLVTGAWTIKPYFHLWFIPAYLSWIALHWLLLRAGLTMRTIFIGSVFLSVGCSALLAHPEWMKSPVMDAVLETFRPDYYIFFALGGFLKYYRKAPPVGKTLSFSLVLLMGEILLFYYPDPYLSFLLFFIFNMSLVCLMISLIESRPSAGNRFLEWVGVRSLGIYLWHVLPVLLAFRYVAAGPLLFYFFALVLEAAFLVLLLFAEKVGFIRKYFLGLGND